MPPRPNWWPPPGRLARQALRPGGYLLAFGSPRTFHRLACAIEDAGLAIKDCLCWLYGQGFPKHPSLLKPAWEPVIVARAPGRGPGLRTHACRFPIAALGPGERRTSPGTGQAGYSGGFRRGWEYQGPRHPESVRYHAAGRWPANVCLDEAAAALLDAQAGEREPGHLPGQRNTSGYAPSLIQGPTPHGPVRLDGGGASRFFYVPKASRRERDAGLGGERNPHPTVKPLALMRWLVRLVAAPGALICDPFAGSGTTAIAALQEGCRCLAVENDPRSVEIACQRIAWWGRQPALPLAGVADEEEAP